jgi:hypothetical protein
VHEGKDLTGGLLDQSDRFLGEVPSFADLALALSPVAFGAGFALGRESGTTRHVDRACEAIRAAWLVEETTALRLDGPSVLIAVRTRDQLCRPAIG